MPNDCVVRPTTAKDLQKVHALFLETLPEECWSSAALEAELHHAQARFFVADCEETLCGFLLARQVLEEGDLLNLAVLPAYRRRGIAGKLMDKLCCSAAADGVTDYHLEVRAGNQAAVCFYERFGFELVGRRKHFYRAPVEDALLYRLQISNVPGGTLCENTGN